MIIAPVFSSAAPVLRPTLGADPVPPTPPTPPTPPPAFDHVFEFPTLKGGDAFKIARGSTANGIGIGGSAKLLAMTPTTAEVWIKAGTFGINKEATIALAQTSPTTASITLTEPGKTPIVISGDIVAVRTNYSEFASKDPALTGAATLQLDATGRFIVDVSGSTIAAFLGVDAIDAKLHLILEKVAPKA